MVFPKNVDGKQKLYKCKYCDKAFMSSQALGGHQNGHRRERDLVNKLHQDPNSFISLKNQGQVSYCPPSNLSLGVSYCQNYYHHPQPYQFNNIISQGASEVNVGPSSRNYITGPSFGNGGESDPRNEKYWRLRNRAELDENEIDLTLRL
ncbi:zinc finger protein GIS-like [Asparagus officinalis]|uniref:zinc finger protein GIS-like n=1 Tax=Asparagus officinalis TaxID=4686 RepID=UPI00098E4465|nr:zinc finger protein GIS-like [Asparagus officinalis]